MKREEVDQMFDDAGITFDDLHEYTKANYNLDNYNGFAREDIQHCIDRIKEWKNGRILQTTKNNK